MLKKRTSSALELSNAAANKDDGLKMEDLAGLELGTDGERMQKMI